LIVGPGKKAQARDNKTMPPATLTLAITGASGSLFAAEMLRLLAAEERVAHVDLVVSDAALRVLAEELQLAARNGLVEKLLGAPSQKIQQHADENIGANIASGSYRSDAMIVLPCSMGTLAGIAHGLASSLVQRAADVALKERRPLILCVRETPFNLIHLRNMTQAAEAGATIYPVMPALYNRPQTMEEIAKQFCCRVLGHLGLRQAEAFEWGAE
jgi:4-hydroxy-3-polyprenylbenzoate decarboxylase